MYIIIYWISDLGVVAFKILVIHGFYVVATAGWKIQILCNIFYFKIMLAITINIISNQNKFYNITIVLLDVSNL